MMHQAPVGAMEIVNDYPLLIKRINAVYAVSKTIPGDEAFAGV